MKANRVWVVEYLNGIGEWCRSDDCPEAYKQRALAEEAIRECSSDTPRRVVPYVPEKARKPCRAK